MQVMAKKKMESVVLSLPSGDVFEVTMIRCYGEEMVITTNANEAMRILKDELNYFGTQSITKIR